MTGPIEQVAPATDQGNQGSAGVAATASADPYTDDEFEALAWSVWSLTPDEDPTRFDELLAAALAFVARIALLEDPEVLRTVVPKARNLLREMQLRVLNGPDHPVRQP